MSLEDAPLEPDDAATQHDWFAPIAMFIAWLAHLFDQIAKLKRVRRTTKFKPNWRDHWQDLRQCEWMRDQILASGAAQLLAGKPLDLDAFIPSTEPPANYGGPCPKTPFEMNRRFLAMARFNADPEPAICAHALRIARRAGIDLKSPLRLAAQATSPGFAGGGKAPAPLASLAGRRGRWRARSYARDGGGSRSSRGPPFQLSESRNSQPRTPRTPRARDRPRLPNALNRPKHPPHDDPRQPHSTYEASCPACAGASFLNDTGRRRMTPATLVPTDLSADTTRDERRPKMTAVSLEADNRNRTIGVMLAAGGAGLFSLKGVVIKLAFAEGIGVSQLLTLRMAFSLPVYLTIGIIAFTRMKQKPALKFFLASGGLGLMSYYFSSWLNFEGLKYVSAQLERLILYIYPTMVALMSWMFLKDKITKQHIIALVLAYAGVAIMFGAEIGHQGPDALLGGGLIFAGAFIYAIYVTASKPVIARMGPTLFTAFGMSVASIAFLTQSGIEMMITAPPPVTANGYWLALTLAIFCTVIPSFMIAEAIGRIGPGPMSAVGGVGPVVAAWAAVAILHEPFGWPHFAAMALTIAGVYLLAKPRITRTAGARTW